uniref:Nuclear pore complex protein Nup153 n=1 Tax=Anopheles christyi TaxID=43041 RepID=A0A182KF87_9DIPT
MSYMGKVSSPRRTEQHSDVDEECEEEDELTLSIRSSPTLDASIEEDDNDRSNSRNHTNTINSSSTSEPDQSFVGKIRSNVTSILSKLVRNAKDKIEVEEEPADEENEEELGTFVYQNSRTYETITKRRRLHDNEPAAALLTRGAIGLRGSRGLLRSSHHSLTNRFDRIGEASSEHATSTTEFKRNAHDEPISNRTPMFGRPALAASFRDQRSTSVFRPSSLFHSIRPNAIETTGEQRLERDEDHEGRNVNEGSGPFDPFKLLDKYDQPPADPSRRMTGFLGNAHYRQRMEKRQRGVVGKMFFSSHNEPAKSLYSSGSESSASSRRPSFSRAAYGGSVSSIVSRIPPEYGGSPFYDGLTRYGGASAARTLATNIIVQRPSLRSNSTLLVRNTASYSSSGFGRRRGASQEPSAPILSSTAQRIMKIVDDYTAAKKNDQGALEQYPSNASIRRELDELIHCPKRAKRIAYPYADVYTPRIPEMLQILREQKTASILNEPVEYVPPPPTVPLMEYTVPLLSEQKAASPIEPRGLTVSIGGGKPATTVTHSSLRSVESTQKLANLHQPEQRREMPQYNLMPSSSLLGEEKKMNGNAETPADNDEQENEVEEEEENENDEKQQENEKDGEEENKDKEDKGEEDEAYKIISSVGDVPRFSFSSPIVLGDTMDREYEPVMMIEYKFAEPVLLSDDFTPKARSFHELMAESASKWVCDVCMIRNEPQQQKCVACESAKPAKKPEKQQQLQFLPTSTQPVRSFHELMAESASKWVCDVCMIRNEPQQQTCVACESAKPAKKQEQQQQPHLQATDSQPVRSFKDLMAESAMKWVCDVCMIRNEQRQQKCVACESAKPAKKPEPQQLQQFTPVLTLPVRPFHELTAESASKWVCDECMVRNEPHHQKCVACESAKPVKRSEQQSQSSSSTAVTGSMSANFAAIVSAQSAQWECTACGVRNDTSNAACVCCATGKSNSTPKNTTHGNDPKGDSTMITEPKTTIVTEYPFSNVQELKDGFKFKSNDVVQFPEIIFCKPLLAQKSTTNSTTNDMVSSLVPSTPSRTGGFQLGSFNGMDRNTFASSAPTPPVTFSFGAPTQSSIPFQSADTVVPESSQPSYSFTTTSTVKNAVQPFVFGSSSIVPSAVSFQPIANKSNPMPQQQEHQ